MTLTDFTPGPPAAAPRADAAVSAWLTDLRFDWSALTAGARRRRFACEEPLFHQGQSADTVYVIDEGRVRLTTFSADGKERHLMIVGPNGLVGDCGLLAHPSYAVSALGATDGVAVVLPIAALLQALGRDPVLMRQHAELAAHRFRILLQQIELQGPHSGPRRVCHHLMGLLGSYGQPHPGGTVIAITFTQQEMGNICGLSRVSVSQIFTQLEREGIVARAGRHVLVRDTARLAVRAQGDSGGA